MGPVTRDLCSESLICKVLWHTVGRKSKRQNKGTGRDLGGLVVFRGQKAVRQAGPWYLFITSEPGLSSEGRQVFLRTAMVTNVG